MWYAFISTSSLWASSRIPIANSISSCSKDVHTSQVAHQFSYHNMGERTGLYSNDHLEIPEHGHSIKWQLIIKATVKENY